MPLMVMMHASTLRAMLAPTAAMGEVVSCRYHAKEIHFEDFGEVAPYCYCDWNESPIVLIPSYDSSHVQDACVALSDSLCSASLYRNKRLCRQQ